MALQSGAIFCLRKNTTHPENPSGILPHGRKAVQWIQWLNKHADPIPETWEEHSEALLAHFGPTDYGDPSKALTQLRQTTTVESYQSAFEQFPHRVDGLPEQFLVGCFVARAVHEVRQRNTIGVAKLVEERNALRPKAIETSLFSNPHFPNTIFPNQHSRPVAWILTITLLAAGHLISNKEF